MVATLSSSCHEPPGATSEGEDGGESSAHPAGSGRTRLPGLAPLFSASCRAHSSGASLCEPTQSRDLPSVANWCRCSMSLPSRTRMRRWHALQTAPLCRPTPVPPSLLRHFRSAGDLPIEAPRVTYPSRRGRSHAHPRTSLPGPKRMRTGAGHCSTECRRGLGSPSSRRSRTQVRMHRHASDRRVRRPPGQRRVRRRQPRSVDVVPGLRALRTPLHKGPHDPEGSGAQSQRPSEEHGGFVGAWHQ